MTTAVRSPRRDSTRNHQLVVDAAREILAELGPDASMEQIAARAGVGVGTVYRHFPGKDALIAALVDLVSADLIATGELALTRTDGTGLEVFLHAVGRSLIEHRRYAGLLLDGARSNCPAATIRQQIADLVVRAKAAHRLADHVELGDVMALIWAIRGLVETAGAVAPEAWERFLDLSLQGLRARDISSVHPPLTAAELARIAAR